MIKVTSLELEYRADGITYFKGKQFTGVEVFQDDSGWKCAEHEYRDGLLSGMKREWHRQGVLTLEAECRFGAFHGRVRRWYESGFPESDEDYEYGIRVRGHVWNEAGTLIEDFVLSCDDHAYGLLQSLRQSEPN